MQNVRKMEGAKLSLCTSKSANGLTYSLCCSFCFMLCPLTFLPPKSVLTNRYTHPLPQYGDIHTSDMRKQHTLFQQYTHTHTEAYNLLDCAASQQRQPFDFIKIKRFWITGREVDIASLPQNLAEALESRWVYITKKTKQCLGKEI